MKKSVEQATHLCFVYNEISRMNIELHATFCCLSTGYFEFRSNFFSVQMTQMCQNLKKNLFTDKEKLTVILMKLLNLSS